MLITGGNAPIVTLPKVEDDPQRRKPDITLAKRELGWQPKVGYSLKVSL